MRISELVERSGIPLATIKYYLRERLLMPGEALSATRASYGEQHLTRLAIIKALTDIVGMPIQKLHVIIELIERPDDDLYATLGTALSALPPYVDDPSSETPDYPRARAALQELGQLYDPSYVAVAQLEHALAAAEAVGVPMSRERLVAYAGAVSAIADYDLANMPKTSAGDAVTYAVLGTALYQPIVIALWRLAHQDRASRLFEADD